MPVTRRSARKLAEDVKKAPDVVEIVSSDSEPEAPEVEDEAPGSAPGSEAGEGVDEQPLLRAASIKYRSDDPVEEENQQQDEPHSPSSAKLTVRTKDTGSAKRKHVSIEIPLPTSSALRRRKSGAAASESHNGDDGDVFRTPKEKKQHITFDDSDHDEFVTPKEGPSRDPLEDSIAESGGKGAGTNGRNDEEDEDDDSDDDAPPEAVSTRAAEVETLKAAEAAAKAAEQQVAALKRKRQERDARLKRQAEERKRAQQAIGEEDEDGDAAQSGQEPTLELERKKRDVPKLLPLELLESDEEDDVAHQDSPAADGQRKRRKLGGAEQALLREPKLPKDKRLGSTAYRIVKGNGDTRLAPKVKKHAVSLKGTLLRRDRVAKPRGGFFVKSR
ncbi:hypothetical protein P885DRAFT_73357 [Corynascus similis CBS 632.67]